MAKILHIAIVLFIIIITAASNADTSSNTSGNNIKFGMQAVMTAKPGKGEELAALMLNAAELAATLKGCKVYIIQLSTSEEDSVQFTEVWESKEDHQASLLKPEIQALISKARPLISGMSHQVGKPLGGVGL